MKGDRVIGYLDMNTLKLHKAKETEMTTFAGKESVDLYRAIVLRSAIKIYAKTKMRANRYWTPTAMKALAERLTGRTFKRGEWDQMIEALDDWIAENSACVE